MEYIMLDFLRLTLLSPCAIDRCHSTNLFLCPQIRNVASGLCIDSKHGSTGTELRLDSCLKEGAERTWAHEQVRLLFSTFPTLLSTD